MSPFQPSEQLTNLHIIMPLDMPSHVTPLHKYLTTCNNNVTHVGTATVPSKETKPRNLITNLHFKPLKYVYASCMIYGSQVHLNTHMASQWNYFKDNFKYIYISTFQIYFLKFQVYAP